MQNHFVGSQATDAPRWIARKGFQMECSKCGSTFHRNEHTLMAYHVCECWVHHEPKRPSLSISAPSTFDYCSFASIAIDSESSAFERINDVPSLSMECSSIIDIIGKDIASTIDNEPDVPKFELTAEECSSFNGTLKQTCIVSEEQVTEWDPAIEQYSLEYSTDNEEDALRWFNDSDCERIPSAYQQWKVLEDRPNGKYVKAMFSVYCEKPNEKTQKLATLCKSIEHHLTQYGVDYSNVNVIKGFDEIRNPLTGRHMHYVYAILPDYCVERYGNVLYTYGCERFYEQGVNIDKCDHMSFGLNFMMGFVKKGTPIIPKKMAASIKATAMAADNDTVSGKTLIREFIAANIDRLKTGKEFTYKDLETFGTLEVFDIVYPNDADKGRHKLAEFLHKYCGKPRKGHSREGAYRNHYKLLPERISDFL